MSIVTDWISQLMRDERYTWLFRQTIPDSMPRQQLLAIGRAFTEMSVRYYAETHKLDDQFYAVAAQPDILASAVAIGENALEIALWLENAAKHEQNYSATVLIYSLSTLIVHIQNTRYATVKQYQIDESTVSWPHRYQPPARPTEAIEQLRRADQSLREYRQFLEANPNLEVGNHALSRLEQARDALAPLQDALQWLESYYISVADVRVMETRAYFMAVNAIQPLQECLTTLEGMRGSQANARTLARAIDQTLNAVRYYHESISALNLLPITT